MNIVLLCKSWNHAKALEILEALRQEKLAVAGIVALAEAPRKFTFADFVRKAYARGDANILRGVLRRFDSRTILKRFIHHPLSQFEHRRQPDRFCRADAFDAHQLRDGDTRQSAQPAVLAQEPLGEVEHILAARASA